MQLHLLSVLLFGVSSNMDNLVVGLAYGIKKVPICWRTNLLVGCISFTGTVLSMLFGKSLSLFLPANLTGILGGLIIILIGVVGIRQFFAGKNASNEEEDAERALTTRKAFLLGAALTVNNVGLGIGASIAGLPILLTAIWSFGCSLVFLYAGNRIGRTKLPSYIQRFAEPLAAVLMIWLGLYEILI